MQNTEKCGDEAHPTCQLRLIASTLAKSVYSVHAWVEAFCCSRMIHSKGEINARWRRLLQLARQIREEVAKLAADFNLPVGEENLLRSVMAEFSLLWCDLEDVLGQWQQEEKSHTNEP